jgi:TonB family protein
MVSLNAVFTSDMTVKMEKDPNPITVMTSSGTYTTQPGAPQRPQPVVAVDGVLTDKSSSEVRKELAYNYGTMNMLQGQAAIDKYGEKGANGVYDIITRKKALEMGLNPPMPRLGPDDYPTFQGKSWMLFNNWVISQLKYPPEAQSAKIEGYVTIVFTIEGDGTISNIKPGQSMPNYDVLNNEVIRVIKASPRFEPPKNSDIREAMQSNITVKFKLPDQIGAEAPFVVVEQMPMYPGGDVELLKFIATNTVYPAAAKADSISGRVIIRFVVNTDGNAEGISVLKGVHPLLDAEAVRVVSLLKGFKPGMQGGKAVPVWYMVPITFGIAPTNPPR